MYRLRQSKIHLDTPFQAVYNYFSFLFLTPAGGISLINRRDVGAAPIDRGADPELNLSTEAEWNFETS